MLNQSHTLNNQHHHQLGHHPLQPSSHHPLHQSLGPANGGNGGQPSYATTHRTFPSAQPADLIFSSLNRKKNHRTSNPGAGPHMNHHMNTADIMDTGGGPGGGGSGTGRRGAPSLWYADLVHGHPQNGKGRNGYAGGTNGGIHSNGYISGNGGVPIARPPHPVGNGGGGPHILPHHNSKHQDIPLIAPGGGSNGAGTGFPIIRGSEINPLLPPGSDLDYADSDYRQLYSYGPMNYKQASLQNNADTPPNNNASKSLAVINSKESEML
ncbi:unnamed protein product [Orchesella dallaii]|uniref:Uncharacterized protein n=1 Tax=Orchesella dallaii TaxID=48710 RepID=A0ABP1QSU9_9HEXA